MASTVIQNIITGAAVCGFALVLSLLFLEDRQQRTVAVQPEQHLKCATGINSSFTLMGIGRITQVSPNTFRIDRDDMPVQYLIKGDMDACVIANPIDELPVPVASSPCRNIDG